MMRGYRIFLNDKQIGSFGVSSTVLGFILIGICVFLHGDTSYLDKISVSPVLASINAKRIPISIKTKERYRSPIICTHKRNYKSTIFTNTDSRAFAKGKKCTVRPRCFVFVGEPLGIKHFWLWIIFGIVV